MRRAAVLVLASFAAALAPAAGADAYRLQPHRWYSRTLSYYDATGGRYRSEIKAAARAWNHSGARVRIVARSRGSARVVIRVDRRLVPAGQAVYPVTGGIVTHASVLLQPNLKKSFGSSAAARAGVVAVIVHEIGHVLGLNHENRRCAIMNSSLWQHCRSARESWRYRCRTLEADDIRGVIRRFGGHVRKRGAEFCAAEAAPGAPVALTAATVDARFGNVRVSFTTGRAPVARVRVLRGTGTCPTGSADPNAVLVDDIATVAGRAQTVDDFVPAPGRYCYAVVAVGPLGRPGALAVVTHDFLGSPPAASFRSTTDGALGVDFEDFSEDPDGRIVAWAWNFGDGTGSAAAQPRHVYAAQGDYTVTLTVTDDTGQTGTSTQVVSVE